MSEQLTTRKAQVYISHWEEAGGRQEWIPLIELGQCFTEDLQMIRDEHGEALTIDIDDTRSRLALLMDDGELVVMGLI